jgi:hypothetical protein
MTATLRWRRSSGGERIFRLDDRDASIGRTADNTIHIESAYVSKHHAVLRSTPAGWTLADLGSSNGTLVNGQSAMEATLENGDTIQIGQEEFVFESAVVPPAAAPVAASAGKPRALVVVVGVAALVLLVLVGLVMIGSRSPSKTTETAAPAASGPAPASAPAPPLVVAPPAVVASPSAAPAAPAATVPDVTSAVPPAVATAPVGAAPGASAGALYDLAIANIKGGRLIEARKLLADSLAREPDSVPARERLRQVDAAIQIEADRHLTAGQRAFTYLKYQDAIIEWEQVVAMTSANDPRYRQAADGIQRARARLAPQ